VSGLGELPSCDTEEPTLERFGNYGEIGKFATACTLVLCGIEIGATERVYFLSAPVVTPIKISVWSVMDITEFSGIHNTLDLTDE
jgi:hypothetical protein